MGNIRQKSIKNIAFKLLDVHGDKFTKNFDDNKHLVTKLTETKGLVILRELGEYEWRKERSDCYQNQMEYGIL